MNYIPVYGIVLTAVIVYYYNSSIACYDTTKYLTTRFNTARRVYKGRSKFQRIEVYKDKLFGHILVIDEDVQLSELDEGYYHEMLVHVPMAYIMQPRRVLIIGGGDGGTLREVCKYPTIEEIVMVEIDRKVVQVSQKFFKKCSVGFDDSRLKLLIMDAFDYLWSAPKKHFDVVLIDVTDFNQSDKLFAEDAINNVKQTMRDTSILAINFASVGIGEENPHKQLSLSGFGSKFNNKRLIHSHQPTFTGGLYTYAVMSDTIDPLHFPDSYHYDTFNFETEFYTPSLHRASFVFPKRLDDGISRTN